MASRRRTGLELVRLCGLAALTPELDDDIERTESLVLEGLDEFFASERQRYAPVE